MSATAAVNARLAALTEAGTSVWLDQIRRTLIEGGELRRLVDQDSLRGVTANPTIFEKAILGSDDYDEELRQLPDQGLGTEAIYDTIAVRDVQLAADVLRPVWEATGGRDGFVSLEVAPGLAHDTEGTLEAARTYWAKLDRPNAMIKIPGTPEGVPAIEEAICEGINVNVTLLFGLAAYEAAAEAYVRGLERRREGGRSLDVNSVASFFVSRLDTEVDGRLEEIGRTDLAGTAALANARAAYARFRELFHGDRFAALREAGAPVQRPLWASTGVKDPRYPDLKYVEGLIGPDTVNTMPMPTLLAVADHGEVPGATAERDAARDLEALAEAGIDMEDVTSKLLRDGVAAFADSMDALLAGIESRREAVVTGRPAAIGSVLPDELEPLIAERLARADEEAVAARIWRRDTGLWGGGPEIADRLGWLTVSDAMLERADDLRAFSRACEQDGLTDVVLLGMGGSSLAPEVLRRSYASRVDGMTLHVLDSTDPEALLDQEAAVDVTRTLFVVSTKSGGTIETLSLFRHFHARVTEAVGAEQAGSRFAAVTDPGSSLEGLARERGFRRVFLNPPDIGGRYSALSYFGLVPAALMGVDPRALLGGAQVAEHSCPSHSSAEGNPGLWLGAALGALAEHGRDKLTFVVDEPIGSLGLWAEQLVAESLGKRGTGIVPVASEPLGPPAAYGRDRVFLHIGATDDPPSELAALGRSGHPVISLAASGPDDLGRIFFLLEYAVAVAGWALGVNPFDQPNVQEAKDKTSGVLEAYARTGSLPAVEEADDDALRRLLDGLEPPRYLALLAYVAPSPDVDRAVESLRTRLREATGVATTFGYGPRYLHSTGQLHKGGPPTGAFLQLLGAPERDADVPEAGYSFGTLEAAQALADLEILRSHGLPAERVRLEGDPAAALNRLAERIGSAS